MFSIDLLQSQPLSTYVVSWPEKPLDWDSWVIDLQKRYVFSRKSDQVYYFHQTIDELTNLSYSLVDLDYSSEGRKALSFAAANLFEIYQLFFDDKVTEAFCNKLGNKIVISHREYGRCITNIEFTKDIWDGLKVRAEYDTGQALTPQTPALKVSLQSDLGALRISLQISPLSPRGPIFNIRRLPKTAYTLEMLHETKMISRGQSEFLTNILQNRHNIVVAGEPGSGKTTLANALLLLTNPTWRLIIMEDAAEIQIDPQDFPMAIQFLLPSLGTKDRSHKRSNEIARLLHRSPDYVFLGELQNEEDTRVAFEGFSAGLRGMATTHARSIEGLLIRWTESHKLSREIIDTIDYVVFTKRTLQDGIARLEVNEIYERKASNFEKI